MVLRSLREYQIFVMPAWIASIQARKDASADIHVKLDSTTPCWNDAIVGCAELTEVNGGREDHEVEQFKQRWKTENQRDPNSSCFSYYYARRFSRLGQILPA